MRSNGPPERSPAMLVSGVRDDGLVPKSDLPHPANLHRGKSNSYQLLIETRSEWKAGLLHGSARGFILVVTGGDP